GPQGGSATQYFIGEFNGQKFMPQDTVTRWIDHGADNYAGVTWSDIPASDGRRLFLGWMSNWQYGQVVPSEAWRSAMTLPREITLMKKKNAYELKFAPVRELNDLEDNSQRYNGSAKIDHPLFRISFDLTESSGTFSLTLSNDKNEKVVISADKGVLSFDRRTSGETSFSDDFPAIHNVNLPDVQVKRLDVFVDLSSVEVFVNDGECVLTEIVFPTMPYNEVRLEKRDPQFSVSSLSPIWK
ncbi:MAG TPA: GH32 C-terminal domain-containing protein, partial [Chryseolinea sp.]|nr:GH32 C-terminal domain-containing protein [Chryseolinea sp.]